MEDGGNVEPDGSCKIAPCASERGEGSDGDISWQHFPRSTSRTVSCDSSSERKSSVSEYDIYAAVYKDEKSPTGTPSTISSGPVVETISRSNADHYLRIRRIFEFFNFLIGHLICREPEDPVRFLTELVDECISARNGETDPPLLFAPEHVKAVYGAFDPFGRGSVSSRQYEEGMRTLGLSRYERNPPLDETGHIKETFFVSEANRRLLENFKRMTRIPKKWEEDRRTYRRKMTERPDAADERREREEHEGEAFRECAFFRSEASDAIRFSTPGKAPARESETKHEPEQLYLTVG